MVDSQQPVEQIYTAHSALISLYKVWLLHAIPLTCHPPFHRVKWAMSFPDTGHRHDCVVMPLHDVHFPVTGVVLSTSSYLVSLLVSLLDVINRGHKHLQCGSVKLFPWLVIRITIHPTKHPDLVAHANRLSPDKHLRAVPTIIWHRRLINAEQLMKNAILHKAIIQHLVQWANLTHLIICRQVLVSFKVQEPFQLTVSVPGRGP
ncbi:hypothetical protein T11_11081 [Trichinella zimbabwensis]|uniref:Uncharacterized protein n=1 Tax=Trichinella zimbabwensis TaxID=268475 RepID=A0A0V1I3C4_9BILA|nr:hypothetical protein T11_11081 [Trichinella zimbabwensis]